MLIHITDFETWTLENKKKIKKKRQGKQYLINQVALTERNRVGCLSFSPTFVIFFIVYYYSSSNVGTSKTIITKGKETGH